MWVICSPQEARCLEMKVKFKTFFTLWYLFDHTRALSHDAKHHHYAPVISMKGHYSEHEGSGNL